MTNHILAQLAVATLCLVGFAAAPLRAQCPDGSQPPCQPARTGAARNDAASRLAAEAAAARRRIAVLYFEDQTPARELTLIADALTEDLIGALQAVQGLRVVSKGGSAAIRYLNAPIDSIARALDVGSLVTGVLATEGQNLRVTVRLLDDAGIEMDRATFRHPRRDPVTVSRNLSEQVAVLVRRRVGDAVQLDRLRTGTRNSEAWMRYQRASKLRDRGDSLLNARSPEGWKPSYAAADSVAAAAQLLDASWTEPIILRGWLEYWSARRAGADTAAVRLRGLAAEAHANRAVALQAGNPRALALRGEVRYWQWLNNLVPDTARRRIVLADAQADLEGAVRREPSLASAWATLSHMYNNVPGKTMADVRIAALRALEADAFLNNADVILGRIALAAFDEGQFAEADRFCREGRRRYPNNSRFLRCMLYNMTMPQSTAAPADAWALADSLERATTGAVERKAAREFAKLLVAVVLGRANQRDSARALLESADLRSIPSVTGPVEVFAAHAWKTLGDVEAAITQLERLAARSPEMLIVRPNDWMFGDIVGHPRFQALLKTRRP